MCVYLQKTAFVPILFFNPVQDRKLAFCFLRFHLESDRYIKEIKQWDGVGQFWYYVVVEEKTASRFFLSNV